MKFKQAYREMSKGKKIKRPGWEGYWFIEDGKVKIKLKTSEILENNFNEETITNIFTDDWEVVEEKKEKKTWWKPEMWQKYYQIDWDGRVFDMTYDDTSGDRGSISIGNCFQTVEQAKFMVEKLKVIHELEKFAYENNEEEIDWNNKGQNKYYLVAKYSIDGTIHVDSFYTISFKGIPFDIYFTSKKIAKKAVEIVGEKRILKYYFDVNEEEEK